MSPGNTFSYGLVMDNSNATGNFTKCRVVNSNSFREMMVVCEGCDDLMLKKKLIIMSVSTRKQKYDQRPGCCSSCKRKIHLMSNAIQLHF